MTNTLNEKMTAAQFNQRFGIGARFKYFPLKGRQEFKQVQTRSRAWTIGSGDTVVNITGQGGGVDISYLAEE